MMMITLSYPSQRQVTTTVTIRHNTRHLILVFFIVIICWTRFMVVDAMAAFKKGDALLYVDELL